ncbi:MAG TPA: asparagine synthase (glutamine-hydrolyzing) [Myxococcota bacterium]|nr:asparagine synthase (glutamine-hydrolyzing) [Myxococcota bacterium]
MARPRTPAHRRVPDPRLATMCGISGVLGRWPGAPDVMADERQAHRGPDGAGRYADPEARARLWFRRLAIIDLSDAANQPLPNEDGTVWVVGNGEIYNFRELRAELQRAGHTFRSQGDVEVLVHLWEEHGRDLLQHLNGMFAFCIWDARTGEAFLAVDHAGIKPLYVARHDGALAFASEAKVLLDLPGLTTAVDPVALHQYLTFLWVPGERTMWRDIRKLAPASWLSWRDGQVEEGTWWDWDQSEKDDRPPDEWAAAVRHTLAESVERQLVSDVPVGILLSGGLDSSAITGAVRATHPHGRIRGYTARVAGHAHDGFSDDLPFARRVAWHLGVDLVEETISPEIASLLPQLVWHSDEPLADPAIAASYLLSRCARDHGTVVLLSGQGADELYHGYRSHRAVRLASRLSGVPAPLMRAATAMAAAAAGRTGASAGALPRRALKMLRFLGAAAQDRVLQLADWGSTSVRGELLATGSGIPSMTDVYGDYLALFDRARAHNDEDRWSYVLFKTFLPALNLTYGDRTSMAASVELRVPFLDRALVEQAGRIPSALKMRGGRPKWVLSEAASAWLPSVIATRPKTGFGAPLRSWLARDLRPLMLQILLGERFLARGLFRREGVVTLLDDLESGRRDVAYIVWALFTFEIWARTFLDRDGRHPVQLGAAA